MLSREKALEMIKKQTHETFDMNKYIPYKEDMNCYAYALGARVPIMELYRIGAISNKKNIEEKYVSEKEILEILYEDLKALGLKYEVVEDRKEMESNQHIIRLYVKYYANGWLADYHFIRCDNGKWSDKRRWQTVRIIDEDYYDKSSYKRLVTLLITR